MALDKTTTLVRDLAEVKRYMQVGTTDTDDDRLIDALISQASVMVSKEVGCDVVQQEYTKEFHSADSSKWLYLENWPIVEVGRISEGRDAATSVTYSGAATHATIEVTALAIKLRTTASGTTTTSNLTFATYSTISTMDTAIDAVSGWTSTVTSGYENYPTTELIRMAARSANEHSTPLEVPGECTTAEVEVFAELGKLYNPYGWGSRLVRWAVIPMVSAPSQNNVIIDYKAGWDPIPEPIRSATMELTKALYDLSQRDVTLRSEKIGDYAYTIADRVGAIFSATGAERLSSMVGTKLTPYKRIVIG